MYEKIVQLKMESSDHCGMLRLVAVEKCEKFTRLADEFRIEMFMLEYREP